MCKAFWILILFTYCNKQFKTIKLKLVSSKNQRVYWCGQILAASFFIFLYLIILLIFVISQSYSCTSVSLPLSDILLLAWFSVCEFAPNWLVIYHKCWSRVTLLLLFFLFFFQEYRAGQDKLSKVCFIVHRLMCLLIFLTFEPPDLVFLNCIYLIVRK